LGGGFYDLFFFSKLFFNPREISVGALSESKILKMSGHVRKPLKLGALYRKAGLPQGIVYVTAAVSAAARYLQRPPVTANGRLQQPPAFCNSRRHRRRPLPVTAALLGAPRFMKRSPPPLPLVFYDGRRLYRRPFPLFPLGAQS
jgi:hypothetical protein